MVAAAILLSVFRNHLESLGPIGLPIRLIALQVQPPDRAVAMPIRAVSLKRVANTWKAPRPGGRTHQGVDIFAAKGTPVLSGTEGVVTRIGESRLGGKVVFVTGRGGRSYYHAHLDDYAPGLAIGQSVHQNDVLGFVGNTGNAKSTPPHLHFGIYGIQGAIDPLPLLVDRAVPRFAG